MTDDNSTEPSEDTTGTKIVEGAPVKITRARGGSRGKDTQVELIPKPNGDNWLNVELLNEGNTQQSQQTGYDQWVERTGRSLEEIEKTVAIEHLAEALSHEDPLVRETADKKLRELKIEQIKIVLENGQEVTEKIRLLRLLIQSDRLDEEEKHLLILEVQELENAEDSKVSGKRKKRFDVIDISEEEKE